MASLVEPAAVGITSSTLPSALEWPEHNRVAWLRLSRGLYLKLCALFVTMLMPLLAIYGYLASGQFWGTVVLVNLCLAVFLDLAGGICIWISGVGHAWLPRLSLSTQIAGLVLAICFAAGIQGGLTLASLTVCIFQLVAVITFLSYVIDLARILGNASTLQKASRCRYDILPIIGCGLVALVTGGVLAVIAIGVVYLVIPALLFLGPIFLFFALLLVYYGLDFCTNYASALAQLRTAAQLAASG